MRFKRLSGAEAALQRRTTRSEPAALSGPGYLASSFRWIRWTMSPTVLQLLQFAQGEVNLEVHLDRSHEVLGVRERIPVFNGSVRSDSGVRTRFGLVQNILENRLQFSKDLIVIHGPSQRLECACYDVCIDRRPRTHVVLPSAPSPAAAEAKCLVVIGHHGIFLG